MRIKISLKNNEVIFPVQKKLYPLEVIQGAAHVWTDRVYAYLEEKKSHFELSLKPKQKAETREVLEALAGEFLNEMLNQVLRQKLIADNRVIYEHVISRAMVAARRNPDDSAQPPEAPDQELSAKQQAEMARLIEEAESEIAGLQSKSSGDPRKITQTWEERHGKPRTG